MDTLDFSILSTYQYHMNNVKCLKKYPFLLSVKKKLLHKIEVRTVFYISMLKCDF